MGPVKDKHQHQPKVKIAVFLSKVGINDILFEQSLLCKNNIREVGSDSKP